MGGVLYNVVNQSEKAVNEVVPGARFVMEAALQQRTIHSGECHVCFPHSLRLSPPSAKNRVRPNVNPKSIPPGGANFTPYFTSTNAAGVACSPIFNAASLRICPFYGKNEAKMKNTPLKRALTIWQMGIQNLQAARETAAHQHETSVRSSLTLRVGVERQ
jgi:hypothetical protein